VSAEVSAELLLAIGLSRFSQRRRRLTLMDRGEYAALQERYAEIADAHPGPSDARYSSVTAGGVSAEWIGGPWVRDDAVILYLHGGCYGTGSVATHRDLITRIAAAGRARSLGLNYRLAPAHPFPAAVDDTLAAYRWLLAEGIAAERIALVGDSAGAGLAVATTLALRDQQVSLPSAIVCISPWVDLALSGASMKTQACEDPLVSRAMLLGWAQLYLGEHDPSTPLASPIYADLHGLPPMLIQVGSTEVLRDDATRLSERATASGVEATLEVWPGMIHVWHTFAPILSEARDAIARIGQFVGDHFAERDPRD